MMFSEFPELHKERKVIVVVSGLANRPDKLGIEVEKELHRSWAEFPADWDKHGKSAGMIRNSEMADTRPVVSSSGMENPKALPT